MEKYSIQCILQENGVIHIHIISNTKPEVAAPYVLDYR